LAVHAKFELPRLALTLSNFLHCIHDLPNVQPSLLYF
jgi:hypothetical protein